MKSAAMLGVLAGATLATTAVASPVTLFESRLGDHPNGAQNPPPYGLRVDGLLASQGGAGGVTTFSFEQNGAGVSIKIVDLDGDLGTNDLQITIQGNVYGGEAPASTYTFGEGLYALDFTMSFGVDGVSNGWTADGGSPLNSGTLTALGSYGLTGSGAFTLDLKAGADMFLFLDDGHRLPGSSGWVGRGWLDGGGTRDFLFTVIPLPGSAGLAMAGLGLVALRRRRTA